MTNLPLLPEPGLTDADIAARVDNVPEAKAERHEMSVFFHEAEDFMFASAMMAPGSTRTSGRKPRSK